MPAQVLKEGFTLTGFRDGKHLVHRWRDDPVAALPEVLRMAVGQVGIVPFDAERQTRLETSCTRTGRPRRHLRQKQAAGRRETAQATRPACTSPRSRTAEQYL